MSSLLERIFKGQSKFAKIGLVGEINTGKTTLANRISLDFTGETMGNISHIPHETREIQTLEKVNFEANGKRLDVTLCDTPGIAQKVDYKQFMKMGLEKQEAINRAKEATSGVVSAIKFLKELDIALVVMDSTKVPFDQIPLTILGTLEMHKTKTIIVANKIDLEDADPGLIKSTFPHIPVVPISALNGDGIENLYSKIISIA